MKPIQIFYLLIIISVTYSCLNNSDNKHSDSESESPAIIYHNGDIITMEGDSPNYVESVVVQNGKIVYTGPVAEAEKNYTNNSKIDLDGTTLLPGFIDAHGHAFFTGFQTLSANLLPPPDGNGIDISELIDITNKWVEDNQKAIGKTGWIIGFGYDDAQLKERRHPTADDLDKISTEKPVFFLHQSGHLGVLNHKALDMMGYDEDSPDPPGGVIRREIGTTKPNGVLEEMAMFIPAFKLMASFDEEANEKIALAGLEAYSAFGFTTVQEGRATIEAIKTWKKLAVAGELDVDLVVYPDVQKELEFMLTNGVETAYTNHLRIGGVKLSLDGSPQGKTAWLTKPYKVPPDGAAADYKGYPAFPDETELINLVDTAFKYNWQVLAHCNGDAAADQLIRAIQDASEKFGNDDRRSVMIHAQTVREDQLDDMSRLGVIPSFFGMHTYYWGDWHRDETLGKERAYRISPAISALNRGMKFTQHHDAPVALPSSIMILHSVVNRISRSGDTIGEDQKLDPYLALKSITSWAAYQYFEEESKGTIEEGKIADFVILDKNPIKVEPLDIINIQVLKTIKEGKTIFKK
jgi:predicted amidohydrolase YtcJ